MEDHFFDPYFYRNYCRFLFLIVVYPDQEKDRSIVFKATIFTSSKILFEGEVRSVFLPGATGEFEVLELHKPILSLLRSGDIVMNGDLKIPVKRGAMRMSGDELVAVVEE